MVTSQQVDRATLTRFAPSVFTLMVAVPIIEQLLRRHDVIQSLKQIYLSIAVAELLLVTAGYVLGLSLIKTTLDPQLFQQTWRHLAAGFAAVFGPGVLSVFSQGARLPLIVWASLSAGLFAAVLFFGFRSRPAEAVTL